ncbi:hypothetical protein FQN60_011066 [Etheostoma spectabile]|uniref:Cyclin-dependent kinase inhibitor domain-containing protein n=1 Tax=Etheostoma spectabile TaxID=54343 RepID=A0A5J5DQY1_9PERO|nr:hypothetical protein FQN60_011066 [Etheostoma spectabile]
MEKVFQHFGDFEEGEAWFPVPLLRRMVPRWTRCPGSSKQKLLLLVLFEEQVMKEALLRHRPVKLLETTVGKELAQVHTVVHKEAHKVRFVVDQCIHHHFLKRFEDDRGQLRALLFRVVDSKKMPVIKYLLDLIGRLTLDPVTNVCAVVGIWKGVQQQFMNTVHIPAASIHQRDEDVSHASRACQDQPWCRIANAFIKGFTSITSALKRDVFEQLHPHFTGCSWSVGILLHQHKVGVVAVQRIHGPMGQVLNLGVVASEECLSVVDHVPGCDANGHYTDFRGGAGQRVIPHSLAQVLGDAKAKASVPEPGLHLSQLISSNQCHHQVRRSKAPLLCQHLVDQHWVCVAAHPHKLVCLLLLLLNSTCEGAPTWAIALVVQRELQPISSLCPLCANVRPSSFKWSCGKCADQSRPEGDSNSSFPLKYRKTFPISTRTTLRMDPIRRRESVCRSLFGPVDHEQLRRDLTRKLQEISEQDRRRWNFNFQTETPLCGRYQWEEIPADCAAAIYQDDACEEDDRLSKEEVVEEEEEEEAQPGSTRRTAPESPTRTSGPLK